MKRIQRLSLIFLLYSICYFPLELNGQTYQDHFGTGNDLGVSVSTSSDQGTNVGANSLNGTELIPDMEGASRFLGQASLGANYEDIEQVAQMGIEAWLEEQINLPTVSYRDTYQSIYDEAIAKIAAVHGSANVDSTRRWEYMNFVFYEKALRENNALRHKVAFALSQIFVVSIQNNSIRDRGFGLSDYYDLLYEGAFGNFHDLLTDITLHPIMGIYLSHFKNQKADPVAGTLPDENYAREIMQLFTIGLYELNEDGTCKKDSNGDLIPTYDIADIQELSKVFTGLSGGAWDLVLKPQNTGTPLTFSKSYIHYDMTVPMVMYEDRHEPGAKTMIDGSVLPAGQSGMQDIADAINVLFNHDNVGPFISTRLIQQLVKSNPTPEYVKRVASVFNNNGQGVRGDLEAVVCAILTDTEARDCTWIDHPQAGKLRQPLERLTHLYTAFDINSPSGKVWFRDFTTIYGDVEQSFLSSPTVFNFFTPFYAEDDYVAANDMVSPEFQILHATSGIHYINLIENTLKLRPFRNRTGVQATNPRLNNDNDDDPFLDFTDEINEYDINGINALIDRVDLILCHGQLSDGTKAIIADAISQALANVNNVDSQDVLNDVVYFIMMSPDYMILR